MKLLSKMYPNHLWDHEIFLNTQKKSSQWSLFKVVKHLLPSNVEAIEEFCHPLLKFKTGTAMVFDIYIPSFNLAIEYQGYQHYYDHYMFGDVNSFKERDHQKHEACNSLGITYIQVPYWWQRDKESIIGLLHTHKIALALDFQISN